MEIQRCFLECKKLLVNNLPIHRSSFIVHRFQFLFFLTLFIFSNCTVEKKETLFQLLDAEETGIHFSNDLSNSDSLIAVSFEYLFNGSGVAIGDFNNDGLSDVFFTANMKASKLYLNEGDMKFKDITTTSKIDIKGKWASGAAVVDINQDGWLDIYVCVGGLSTEKEKRSNLLFINQKNNTFTEESKVYGLDDSGYSINAAFFDYDRDGDLDMYLLTTELDPYNWTNFSPRRLNGEAPNNDRLYRNNSISKTTTSTTTEGTAGVAEHSHPLGVRGKRGEETQITFTNVSKEAGIQIEGYGLGIALCDLNKDGNTDLYIANDFLSNDIIYINNGDGTFTDKIDDYLSHTSRNGMGIDMQDINNDGHTDIMVLDMLPTSNARQKSMFGFFNYDKFKLGVESGYQPQYARNTLQLNNGNGTFSEVGQMAGVDRTDWSWCSLFADFDNDGWQDLFITNGYRQDITNMDFATFSRQVTSSPIGTDEAKRKQMMTKLSELPEIKMSNFIFKNEGKFPFVNKTKEWGFDLPTYSNGAAYADLDNDGDLDLVINNIDERAYIYQNNLYQNEKRDSSNYLRIKLIGNESNPQAIGAKVNIVLGDKLQTRLVSPYRGYFSSVENVLHFGLGNKKVVDEIKVVWQDGRESSLENIPTNQLVEINYAKQSHGASFPNNTDEFPMLVDIEDLEGGMKKLGINFTHEENDFVDFKIQPILPHKHSQGAPALAVGDVNGDGLEDFYVSGSADFSGKLFLQLGDREGGKGDNNFEEKDLNLDATYHDMGALLFDADNDEDLDLYIVSGGTNFQSKQAMYQDRLYLNDGKGNFTKSTALPKITASGASVTAADYDKDGDLDLFVTGRIVAGAYPIAAKSYLLRNDSKDGQVQFADISNELPNDGKLGLVSAALWTDTDNDGFVDIMLAGEWMPITMLKGNGKSFSEKIEIPNSGGWWNSMTAGDFDKDGDIDYMAGNLGLNSRYEASEKEPVCVYAKDFDKNGRIDPVMCHYIEGQNYLAHSRDMLIKQINSMRVRFKTYTEYGTTPFDKSFTKKELSDALVLKSETFATSYIENLGNGKFNIKPMPTAAQVAPIYGMLSDDFNGDGNLDVMMIGNSYATEIMVGQYDACKGVVMLGDGKGGFTNSTFEESGFFVDKDAKALAKIMLGENQPTYLATRNRESLKAFTKVENTNKINFVKVKASDSYALIEQVDGAEYKVEFYFGSSYLSQSSRVLNLSANAKQITIFDVNGKSRIVKSELLN